MNHPQHQHHGNSRWAAIFVAALALACLGYYFISSGNAATVSLQAEAEAGVPSNAAGVFTGPATSGGRVVTFGMPPPCTSNTAYTPVQSAPVSTASPGFKHVALPTQYYSVNGYTVAQIRQQLNTCSSALFGGVRYDAATHWYTNAAWSWIVLPNGLCDMGAVAVSTHTSQLMPRWNETAAAGADVSNRWKTYMTNLALHEKGHVDSAVQRSQKIHKDILDAPPTNCATINQSAQNTLATGIEAMRQAEINYDIQTQHGATQGAIFP